MNRRSLSSTKKLLIALSLCLSTASSFAADTSATGNVSVTVSTTITLTETTAMNFGTFYALGNISTETDGSGSVNGTATPADSAYLDLAVNGTVTSADGTSAKASSLTGTGTAAVFTISTAAFNAPIKFTSNVFIDGDATAAIDIFDDDTGGESIFHFTDLILDVTGNNVADNDLAATADGQTVNAITNGSGALVVRAGGRIYTTYTNTTNNWLYEADSYSGTYDLTVSY